MDTAWTSTGAALQVATDDQVFVEGAASNLLRSSGGAAGQAVHFEPAVAVDLSTFDELRFWVRADRVGDGSAGAPFYLEFAYTDANDGPGDDHRWLVPINQPQVWEQRRVGVEADRRSAISGFRLRCLTNGAFSCRVDELLAVREEMLSDLENALSTMLSANLSLPGLTNLPLQQAAAPGVSQIVLGLNRHVFAGNRTVLRDGLGGEEIHDIGTVTHNVAAGNTTLALAPGDQVQRNLPVPGATASVVLAMLVESPPMATPGTSPAIVVTSLGPREDLDRSPVMTQRDSFRQLGSRMVCSVRPGPRAYLVDYQLVVVAPERSQHQVLMDALLRRLSIESGLRINGVPSPLAMEPAPALFGRAEGTLGPVYVRIGTRMEVAPRQVLPWVSTVDLGVAPPDSPADREDIRLVL
jgi:hypothetical protein